MTYYPNNRGPAGACRASSCRAPIRWAETDANHRRIPLDPAPTPATGNIRLVERESPLLPLAEVLSGERLVAARLAGEDLFTSHFATCPAKIARNRGDRGAHRR